MSEGPFCTHQTVRLTSRTDHWRCECGQVFMPLVALPEIQPGDPIASVTCPCCGAALDIAHGDDPGEVGVVGTPDPGAVEAAATGFIDAFVEGVTRHMRPT